MPNPTGKNQYSGGRGGKKKGAPKFGAADKKFKAAGIGKGLTGRAKKSPDQRMIGARRSTTRPARTKFKQL